MLLNHTELLILATKLVICLEINQDESTQYPAI